MPIKGTYYNATLGAAPTTSGHLGYWVQGSLIATSTSSSPNTIYSISLAPGNWIVVGNATFQVGVTYAALSISATNNTRDNFCEVLTTSSGSVGPALNITRFVNPNVTITIYLVAQASSAANVSSTYIQATRVG